MSFNKSHLQKTKESDERYTPSWVFEYLGLTFDVDVCAPIDGAKNTPCRKHFSIIDDGLTQEWQGLIYMNPPYSSPKLWMEKFRNHNNGVALVATSQGKWFTEAWYDERTYLVPMPNIKFETANGVMPYTAPFRSWLIAMGTEAQSAAKRLEQIVHKSMLDS